ncbi:MotA/TolQ/ExbB proton channel family protein [Roseovarius sp. MMSF_3281]|uniref:MotA/TolQ/ExbB proton channel family protein n=1 Tax=Roseovarius sp. MMSF_3281 TaxID=3046694 RepID=UPI00273F8C93|nr:MotA/TolQ/ExbB proton channel family protein [Roseovarius sp. MMSF_3281]
MTQIEFELFQLAGLFFVPVLGLIVAALAYAFFALGTFVWEALQRLRGRQPPLDPTGRLASEDFELKILKRLEWLRIVSRTAPMLGLVATMIPMGPALLALNSGDAAAMSENLVMAFSAVILALVAASITFFILTVRRRWLLEELRAHERALI